MNARNGDNLAYFCSFSGQKSHAKSESGHRDQMGVEGKGGGRPNLAQGSLTDEEVSQVLGKVA